MAPSKSCPACDAALDFWYVRNGVHEERCPSCDTPLTVDVRGGIVMSVAWEPPVAATPKAKGHTLLNVPVDWRPACVGAGIAADGCGIGCPWTSSC